MAGWDSHLPEDLRPARVAGLGLNENELRENAALAAVLTWALANTDVVLPHSPKPMPEWLKARSEETR